MVRGSGVSRAQRVLEAHQLREEGLLQREIAERMGVALKTVNGYLTDPDLSKQRARRKRYAGRCELCDGPMDGSDGYKSQRPGRICADCREWTPEELLEALRDWWREHGTVPRKIDLETDDRYPSSRPVMRRFGSWNNGLRAAGFRVNQDKGPERHDWIVEQIRAGRRTAEIAEELGVTESAIGVRLRYHGVRITDLRRVEVVA